MLKQKRGRVRLIGDPTISFFSDSWVSKIFEFKNYLQTYTQYQFLDNYIYWELNQSLTESTPYFSVLGASTFVERSIQVHDLEPQPYWAYSLDSFTLDSTLLRSKIESILVDIPAEFDKNFHLVVQEEKIELHFFLQKDYIG